MGYFNARIDLEAEDNPNSNGKRLLDLVYMFGNGLDVIKMVVEDSGNLDIGSDHYLIWGEVMWGRIEVEVRRK